MIIDHVCISFRPFRHVSMPLNYWDCYLLYCVSFVNIFHHYCPLLHSLLLTFLSPSIILLHKFSCSPFSFIPSLTYFFNTIQLITVLRRPDSFLSFWLYCACAVLPVMRNAPDRMPTPACLSDHSCRATSRTYIAPHKVTTTSLAPSSPERIYRLHYTYQCLSHFRIYNFRAFPHTIYSQVDKPLKQGII